MHCDDLDPALSLTPGRYIAQQNTFILRPIGEFDGPAGLRLSYVLSSADVAERLAKIIGPWPV